MASQYRKIEDFPGIYWEKESPVTLEKIRLARDTYRGANVLQLTFRNVSNANIYGLSISISMKDFAGKKVLKKDIEYNYYGMETAPGKTFGGDDYIYVEPEGKSFQITVKRAEFSEGAMFRGSSLLAPMPEPSDLETLGEFQEPFTEGMAALYPKAKLLHAPEDKLYYWRCTCGHIYPHTMAKCAVCNVKKESMFQILKDLKAEKQAALKAAALAEQERLAAQERARLEEEERRRLEEELEKQHQEEKKRKRRRFLAVFIPLAAACLLLFVLWPHVKPRPVISDSTETAVGSESTEPEPSTETEPAETPDPVETQPVETEPVETEPPFDPTPLAILGQDLDAEDMRLVLRLIGMEQDDFEQFDVIYVSSEDEINYLTGRYEEGRFGGRSLTSVLITPTEPGSGLNVSTYNITYCTEDMYAELLLEAGFADADVVVAGPHKISGTAALAGILKAGDYLKEEME